MGRMMDFEGRTGAVAYIHQQISGTLSHLDAKATIFSSLATAAIVYLVRQENFSTALEFLLTPSSWRSLMNGMHNLEIAAVSLAVASVLAYAFVFLFSIRCLQPRLSKSLGCVVYFKGISSQPSAQEYAAVISGMDEALLSEQLSRDCYFLASIVTRKYRYTAYSAWLLLPATFFLVSAEICRIVSAIFLAG